MCAIGDVPFLRSTFERDWGFEVDFYQDSDFWARFVKVRGTFRLYSHYNGSIFGLVRKSIRYNVNSAWGNQTGPVWSWAVHTLSDRYLCWFGKSKPTLESKRVMTRFCSKNGVDPLNSPFTLVAERPEKVADTERITSGIGAFQLIIVTGIVPDRRGQMWTEDLSDMIFGALR